jgi:ABC-type glycerol-3-phosphate transport system substrate-binding protein
MGHRPGSAFVISRIPSGGRSWAISKYSKVKDATALVLELVSSPEQSLKIVMDSKTIMDPWRNSHFTSEKFRSAFPGADEYLDAIKASFLFTVPDPQIPGGDEYRRKVANMVIEPCRNQFPPRSHGSGSRGME